MNIDVKIVEHYRLPVEAGGCVRGSLHLYQHGVRVVVGGVGIQVLFVGLHRGLEQIQYLMDNFQCLVSPECFGIYFCDPRVQEYDNVCRVAKPLEHFSESSHDGDQFRVVVVKPLSGSNPPQRVQNGKIELV